MTFTTGNILLIGAVLLMAGILIQKPGYRFGIPALLLFLVVGMIFGCDGLGVQFDDVRGAQFVGMMSLSIILFAGGLGTRIKDIKPILAPGIVLSTVGVLLTTAITGIFVWWISGLSWTSIHFALLPSMLLAATMSSTDSASVFGILGAQKMNLKHNLRPTLELESGSNDPMAYLITTMLVDVLVTGDSVTVVSLLRIFLVQFVLGALLGFAFGRLGVWMLNRLNLDNRALYPIMAVAICFLTFSLTDTLGGNGYLAIYVTGIVIGNEKVSFRRETITFIDGLSWLCQIVMFLMLGLLVNPLEMWQVAGMALLIGLFIIVVARPISVFFSLIPFSNIPFKGKVFISWVGLRGAVPILFATYPVVAGLEDHHTIFNIVFFITILSLLVQGTTIKSMAQYLKLSEPLLNDVSDFGVEIPEDSGSSLKDLYVTSTMLEKGSFVRDLHLPQGQLVMMVKRDNELLVPNGQLELREGDHLLIIQETKQ